MAEYLDLAGLEEVRNRIRGQHYSKAEMDKLLADRPVFLKFDGVIDNFTSISSDKMEHSIGKIYFIKEDYVFKRIEEDALFGGAKFVTCGEPYNHEITGLVIGGGRNGWTARPGIYYCGYNLYRVKDTGDHYVTIGECQFE